MPDTTLGQRLRQARRHAGLTLQQLAAHAGVSASFLSQAERGLTGLSLSSLANIAQALALPVSALIDAPPQATPDSHQGQRQCYQLEQQPQSYERLSTRFPGSQISAVKMTLPAGYHSETVSHAGDEFVYVLSGQVCYCVAGTDYRLAAGDSLHFDARQPHSLRNEQAQAAELLSAGTLDVFADHSTQLP